MLIITSANKYMKRSIGCHSGLSGIILNSSEGFPTCLPDRQARCACGNDNFNVFNRRSNKWVASDIPCCLAGGSLQ